MVSYGFLWFPMVSHNSYTERELGHHPTWGHHPTGTTGRSPPASPKPPRIALPSCSTATLGGTITVTLPQKAVERMVMTWGSGKWESHGFLEGFFS